MKLPAAHATEVYINSAGTLTIIQVDADIEGGAIVALTRDQAMQVANEIIRLNGNDAAWHGDEEE